MPDADQIATRAAVSASVSREETPVSTSVTNLRRAGRVERVGDMVRLVS